MTSVKKYFDSIFSNSKTFWVIIGLFLTQSVWIALTAIYPLPFDEYYHVGVTKIYAEQWSPFITEQSLEASIYGDITRTTSYLFHYLMSFPYRLLSTIFNNQEIVIIGLRLMNVLMVVSAIYIFRNLFIRWGISKKITHFVLLIFVFTPIVPFLAAHHNYDNLLLLLTSLSLWLITDIIKNNRNYVSRLYYLFAIGLIGVLVKEQFLIIYGLIFATALWLVFTEVGLKSLINRFRTSLKKLDVLSSGFIIFSLLILGFLVIERYGINLIKYNALRPKCEIVQTLEVCDKNMPWHRNRQNKLNPPTEEYYGNFISFSQHWASKMVRGFFVPFSHTPTMVTSNKEPYGPIVQKGIMPLPITVAYLVILCGIPVIIFSFRHLIKNRYLKLSIVIVILYLLVLLIFNYRTYLKLGVAQAIQARYTYPVLLIMYLVLAKSYSHILRKKPNLKYIIGLIVILTFVWGGGITGYLIRADDTWYWQNHTVISVNRVTQEILKKIVIH